MTLPMSKSDLFYLEHILDQINYLADAITMIDEVKFSQDRTYQNAFCRSLEIIGEATKNIGQDFQNKHPDLPWSYMAKTRDRVIHHYFDIDYSTVWDIVKNDVLPLKSQIEEMLNKLK